MHFDGLSLISYLLRLAKVPEVHIDDAGLGPEAGSIEYGYRVPFGSIHVFIGKIGEPGPEPDICTELVETAQLRDPPGLNRP